MKDRHQARILAMQALCQLDVLGDDSLAQLDSFFADESPPESTQKYARGLVHEIWQDREAFDASIQAVAEHWVTTRMSAVDRNVLRVGLCEMRARPEVPTAVAINEAVEIAKIFGTADSPAFVNGVLDALRKQTAAGDGAGGEAATEPVPPVEG